MSVYIGCSGWYYDHWVGKFYPEDLQKIEWLPFYAERLDTVEINATFYRFPSEKMVSSWHRRVPEGFLYTAKVSRLITHRKRFSGTEDLTHRFYDRLSPLKEKLACFLFQLPPSMKKDLDLLEEISNQMDRRRKNVIEFRHPSWFSDQVIHFLDEKNIGYCIVSAPEKTGIPERTELTSDYAYIRLHGRKSWYSSNYSEEELNQWAEVIEDLQKEGAKEVYVYFNNDFQAYAIENALKLKRLVEE